MNEDLVYLAGFFWVVSIACGVGALIEARYWMKRCDRAEKLVARLYTMLADRTRTTDDALVTSTEIARIEDEVLGVER